MSNRPVSKLHQRKHRSILFTYKTAHNIKLFQPRARTNQDVTSSELLPRAARAEHSDEREHTAGDDDKKRRGEQEEADLHPLVVNIVQQVPYFRFQHAADKRQPKTRDEQRHRAELKIFVTLISNIIWNGKLT